MTEISPQGPTTLTDYLAVLRRRKWIIIVTPIAAALLAFLYSSSQPSVYRAQATVLIKRSAGVAAGVTGVQDPATYDSVRYLTNQARIARSPRLAARVAAKVPPITADAVLAASSAIPDADADLLTLSVSYGNPGDAVTLANVYAEEFRRYKTELETDAINDAVRALEADAARLRERGETTSPAYERLVEDRSRLTTIGRLAANNTEILQPAAGAAKIEPRPRRSLVLGELLGLVFALGVVFLAEALDRRVRSESEIEALLDLPLLGRIPRPPRALRENNELVMLAEPTGLHAEAFRKLRGMIEFVSMQRGAASRAIMFTSAAALDGKSTTVANLAIALARSGQRVALVDLDLRRPFLHTLFGSRAEPGFTDVVVGREALARAVHRVPLPAAGGLESLGERNGQRAAATDGTTSPRHAESMLHLLPCGTTPPAVGEFLASKRVAALVEELREHFDVVLVDTPPMTVVGDAVAVSATVDAIIVVTPSDIERPVAAELARELQNCSAAKLGFVLTGVAISELYQYGYGLYPADRLPVDASTERREQHFRARQDFRARVQKAAGANGLFARAARRAARSR